MQSICVQAIFTATCIKRTTFNGHFMVIKCLQFEYTAIQHNAFGYRKIHSMHTQSVTLLSMNYGIRQNLLLNTGNIVII